jgi:class 3 adenylate cyclase/tetratricopeptide (TPR) repeat protein
MEGERKQISVLFADLKGSMELLSERDPEEARALLDPVLERLMEAVHRYEGTVNQVMGDGIMALFGAPLAHEDHAVRACYAALRMQETVKQYAEQMHRTAGVPLYIRVGINSGEVVVRSIQSDLHVDYSAVGHTTHLAARLEQMAMPGTILISPSTLKLGEGFLQVKPIGTRPVRGLQTELEIFELVSVGTARSRLQAAAIHGLTHFVGREPEMAELRHAQALARAGQGQVVTVVGEPGVGKSRLFWELTHSHSSEGWLVVESVSVSYAKATSLLPLAELLRSYFRIESGDDAHQARQKITRKLLSLDRAFDHFLPALLWMLEVPVEDPQWGSLDPPLRRLRALDAIKQLLLRESSVQPLLLVFEDLHWIDAETQAFLDEFVESLASRVLLLVNYRPDYQHAWGTKTYYRQVTINPLAPKSTEQLLEVLLGKDPALSALKRLLIERTAGNPFFVEESVRSLVETGDLTRDRDGYRLLGPVHSLRIPATAQAMLAARIDRLTPENKRLLQAASVLGKDVPFALLQALAEVSEEELRGGLGDLQAAQFLFPTRLFPEPEYTFKHALTHEVAYGSLLTERRRHMHTAAVDAIETLYSDRLMEHVEQLAHHSFRGEMWHKAQDYLRQAGARASARSAYPDAVSYFEQGLAALGRLPQDHDTLRHAIDIRLELRSAFGPLGESARMYDVLRDAEAIASSIPDSRRLGQISAHLAYYFASTGKAHKGVAAGQQALAMATKLGDRALDILASVRLGQAYFTLGDYQQALESMSRNVEAVQGHLGFERFSLPFIASVYMQAIIAECLTIFGNFESARISAQKAVQIAENAGHHFSLVMALKALGMAHLVRGEAHEALRWLERAVELCSDGKLPIGFCRVARDLGRAYTLVGRSAEALEVLHLGIRQSLSIHVVDPRVGNLAALGDAYLQASKLDDALRCSEEALQLSRAHELRGLEAEVLRILADTRSLQGSEQAHVVDSLYHEAIKIAEPRGMRPLVAQCCFGRGILCRRTDQRQKSRDYLAHAATLYRAMDMPFWADKAELEIREIRFK